MAMSIYTSSDEKWCFAGQTTWGTAVGDTAASYGILTEGFGINSAINFRNPPRARAQRYNTLADMQADQKGVVYQTEGMNVPATIDIIDTFLYGVMQNVTESSGTPYEKTFTFPLTQPDFTTNEGIYFTLWNAQQVNSTDAKLSDAIISELSFSCAEDSNEGELWASPVFMGLTHSDTANYTGTITYPTLDTTTQKYFYDIVTCTLGGDNCVIGSNGFTITIKNNARKVGQSSGKPQTFALPRYDVEITMSILWDATARNLIADAKAGTTVAFVITWGSSGVNGHLSFTGSAKISSAVNLDHAVDGNFVPINLICGGTYGTTQPFQAVLSNATDRGW